MKFGLLASARFGEHDTADHVESPRRNQALLEALASAALAVEQRPLRRATDDEILSLHHPSVLEKAEQTAAAGGGWLDPDTMVSPQSVEVAREGLGGAIDLARAVAKGELDRGFACLRPPGHHATPRQSMGFCLFSNIALVARACRDLAPRIFIFDWDVHHGNGTQDCLYEDPDTCFFSFHQSPFYPGTGAIEERGAGPGEGLNYNLPLPAGCADAEYLHAYDLMVSPAIRAYQPDLILVSAGYDAHGRDPLGGMRLTTEGFRQLAQRILHDSLAVPAQGKLVGLLEGGYNTAALAQSVVATLEAWMGEPVEPDPPNRIHPQVLDFLETCRLRLTLS
ncbi:MAG: histone deacetylase [Vulcanimicrobiota bacterium]